MATEAKLKAKIRDERGKGPMRRLRAEGLVPAVVYGHNEETRALTVDEHELSTLFSHISVDNTIIDLDIEGEKGDPVRTLVREVQMHPFKPRVLHVDFYQIHAGEMVDVDVPVHLVGKAEGVKEGGILDHVIHELPVRCLPAAIPQSFEIDVSALQMGESVHVSELEVPEGVVIELDPQRTICAIVAPAILEVVEEEEVDELADLEPELIGAEGEEVEGEGETEGEARERPSAEEEDSEE